MEPADKMVNRVKFVSDVKEATIFTPLRKLSHSAVRKHWIRLCQNAQYQALKEDLVSYSKGGFSINHFFIREGETLLDWAIVSMPTADALEFICQCIPGELIQNELKKDNFYVLTSFLRGENGMDRYAQTTKSLLENRDKKYLLLIKTDPSNVKEFMISTFSHGRVLVSVRESFFRALAKYEEEQRQLLKC